ncbi:PREDICTED: fucolectin-like [Branchiostoma belcheri]|uniref:Fucolectin-like n=1 Tax=Branchiostoma belcheri TaxID=7741 RepID=A0A6P4Y0B1_BRABE|nr:PREDICTED: fucolectin-like [Branchiostoma belcheri]
MAGSLTLFAVLLLLGHSAAASECVKGTRNLAKGRWAIQRNTMSGGDASRAVDGNKSPYWSSNSCTHTKFTRNPWWRVDLGSTKCVAEVVVVNRIDSCCNRRLEGFTVHVGHSGNPAFNPSCGGPQSVSKQNDKGEIRVDCGGLRGQYVGISLKGNGKTLTLCEVEVYGESRGRKRGGYYGALTGTGLHPGDL